MTPQEVAFSLRRLCEIADITAQSGDPLSEDDEAHLQRIEALADLLYQRNEPPPIAPSDRKVRPVVWDSPEDVAIVQEVVATAEELIEVSCGICHDTMRVMRQNRKGDWVQSTTPCPECTASAPTPTTLTREQAEAMLRSQGNGTTINMTGVTTAMQAINQAARRLRLGPSEPEEMREHIRVRDREIYVGDFLSKNERIYLRAMTSTGPDSSRLLAREILDEAAKETWALPNGLSLRIGQRMELPQYIMLTNVAAGRRSLFSDAQIDKAVRFLDHLPRREVERLEAELLASRQGQ